MQVSWSRNGRKSTSVAMEVTKPYEFIGFGAMEVTKPYELIGFGARVIHDLGADRTRSILGVPAAPAAVENPSKRWAASRPTDWKDLPG